MGYGLLRTMEIKYDNIGWVHIKDRKVLVNRSFGKESFFVPGGKREGNEHDHQTLTREMNEELTVDILQDSIQHLHTFEAQAHGKPEGTFIRLACYTANYNGSIAPSNEIEEVGWFSYANRDAVSPVSQLVFDHLKELDLID